MAQQQEPGLGLRQLRDGIQERAGLVDALSHSLLFAKSHTTNWRPQQREAGGGVDRNTRREDSSIDGRVRPTTWDQFTLSPPNIQHCTVQCVLFVPSLRRLSSVAVARSSLRPTVLISNPLVWVKLQDFLVPSAPGLKVWGSHPRSGGRLFP